MIGTTLLHYRIVDQLGAGGMGEVYRAQDTKLDREVAIKVLPPDFADHPERLARFEREAKTLAALNHAHIATVHGFEQDGATHFLVMELVEGESLAGRISRGPLPLDEALGIARQLAAGLEAAHERGVVHRDLKPANVMLTPNGDVKILDFGLAKIWQEPAGDVGDLTHSPTLSGPMTRAGVLLGTAAYMSPEQARGQEVDKRADIWAFGVILYEMLTGERLFGGPTVTDSLAATLRAEIDYDALPDATPPGVARLLRRCLEREPRDRLRDIGDARLELEDVGRGEGEPPPPETLQEKSRLAWLPWAAAVLVALLAGFGLPRLSAPEAESAPAERGPLHVSLSLPEELRLAGWGTVVALSPDGRKAAYVTEGPEGKFLYVHHLDTGETQKIEGSNDAESPFFSPDGEWVAFGAGSLSGPSDLPPELRKASLSTGIAQTVAPLTDYFGGTWAPDGSIYLVEDAPGGIFRVDSAGGAIERVTPTESRSPEWRGKLLLWPVVLPGGDSLLAVTGDDFKAARIVHVEIATGRIRDLGIPATLAQFVDTGHLVWANMEGELYAAAFDPKRGEILGSPVALARDLARGYLPVLAVAASGAMVYAQGYLQGSGRELTHLVRVASDGTVSDLGFDPAPFVRGFTLSPDGRRLATGTWDGSLWIYDLVRGTRSKLPAGELSDQARPTWSPDGTTLVSIGSQSDQGHLYGLFVQPADGTGAPQLLLAAPGEQWPMSFVPNSRQLLYRDWSNESPWQSLWQVDLGDPGNRRELLAEEGTDFVQAAVSPDGRWLAYVASAEGQTEVWLRTYPEIGAPRQVSIDGGFGPTWGSDGRLFYWGGAPPVLLATRVADDGTPSSPTRLFELPELRLDSVGAYYAPTPQGDFLAMLRDLDSGVVTRLELVIDWSSQLVERVPPG